jgi:hypothetical protein
MLRWLARTVALLTVLTATVNAQCAISCELLTPQTEQQEDHSCCRHHRAPAHSCVQLDSHKTSARLDVHRAVVPEPLLALQTEGIRLSAPLPAFIGRQTESTLPPPDTVTTSSVLRI